MTIGLTLLAFFICGFIAGAVFIILFTLYLINGKSPNKGKKVPNTVNARIKQVKEIVNEQLELQNNSNLPQKSALHGKYQNGLIGRIKELETQKNDILRSIISDGFDPILSTIDESGVVTSYKLSEYMVMMGITMPSTEAQSTKVGKLSLVKDDKPED